MRILLVTPAERGSTAGNRVTAHRWARLLRKLGHRVEVRTEFRGGRPDLLVALHARKSSASVRRLRTLFPTTPIVVACTGTDLYRDLPGSRPAQDALKHANLIVVLQPLAIDRLPRRCQGKARVIYQSADAPPLPRRRSRGFEVCVVGHLRAVKDPFRTALASRRVPEGSRIHIVHIGRALNESMARRARAEAQRNARYRWIGERSRAETLRRLGGAQLVSLTSRSEGGANVISEAIMASVPVVASKIAGSVGLLGNSYPGYFPFGDTRALASLMLRVEGDKRFRRQLTNHCARLRPLFTEGRERGAWATLLTELEPNAGGAL